MIALVAFGLVLLAVSWLSGTLVLTGLRSLVLTRPGDRWIVSAWAGCLSLASMLLVLSIVTPLTPLRSGLFVAVVLALACTSRTVRRECGRIRRAGTTPWILVLVGSALVFGALFTRPVVLYDTGLYHYGSIDWLSRFGTVKGTGLLFYPLGRGSSWFAVLAPFNAGAFEARLTEVASLVVLVLAVMHMAVFVRRWLRRSADAADWFGFLGLGIALLTLPFELAASPSPDVPLAFLVVETAYVLIRLFQQTDPAVRGGHAVVVGLLSGGAAAVKFSSFSLAAFALIAILFARLPLSRLAVAAGTCALMAAPLVVFNTIASGCPLNPSNICLSTSWSPSAAQRADMIDQFRAANQWGGVPPSDANAVNWIWRRWLIPPRTSLRTWAVLVAVLLVIAVVAWLLARRRVLGSGAAACGFFVVSTAVVLERRFPNVLIIVVASLGWLAFRRTNPRWTRMALALGISGVIVTLFGAPLVRLCAGFLAVAVAAMVTPAGEPLGPRINWLRDAPRRTRRWVTPAAAGVLVVALVAALVYVPGIGRSQALTSSPGELVVPAALPHPPVMTVSAEGVVYRIPTTSELCWATPLPCVAHAESAGTFRLQDPDRGIRGGFRLAIDHASGAR